jgi:hypothetical protein
MDIKHANFYEELEDELAPLTDDQVDSLTSAAESDLRYRLEIWFLFGMAAICPMALALLGAYLLRLLNLGRPARLIFVAALIALLFGSVRLLKALAGSFVTWRFRSSFLRHLAQQKHRSGC